MATGPLKRYLTLDRKLLAERKPIDTSAARNTSTDDNKLHFDRQAT